MIRAHKNQSLEGRHGPIGIDVFHPSKKGNYPCLIYSHGFKGFKDWGHSDLLAKTMAEHGVVFIKFNYSHNGIKANKLTELTDLSAFAQNNFSIELDDLEDVIDFACEDASINKYFINPDQLFLFGHSRGGGMSILKAADDKRIKKVVTLGAVHSFKPWTSGSHIEEWKQKGVYYAVNSRTKQELPMNYQIVEDYLANQDRLSIENVAPTLEIPVLLIHGTNDAAVHYTDVMELAGRNKHFQLMVMEDENHVFGSRFDWDKDELSLGYQNILPYLLEFLVQ